MFLIYSTYERHVMVRPVLQPGTRRIVETFVVFFFAFMHARIPAIWTTSSLAEAAILNKWILSTAQQRSLVNMQFGGN